MFYGAIHALKGVSLRVGAGEIVTLIGANGAGKSTTLRSINGLNHPRQGSITFPGRTSRTPRRTGSSRAGSRRAPKDGACFPRMSVTENLEMGAFQRTDRENFNDDMDRVFELFPRLHERAHQKAGTMSGGEQQMCAIGRALMARPTAAAPRRAVDGARSHLRREDLRDRDRDQPAGHAGAARRAERAHGARRRAPRIRDGDRV